MVALSAPAKINLFLHITGKRADGYHLLDSLVVFAEDVCDHIKIEPAKELSLTISGPFAKKLDGAAQNNLVWKAAQRFARLTNNQANIHISLEKNIPPGAGLGGGSADAAAMIKGLERLWRTSLPEKEKANFFLSLGADVPVCYHGKTCRFQGVGEIISSAPELPPLNVLLAYPGVHCTTADIFRHHLKKETSSPDWSAQIKTLSDLLDFLHCTQNDLSAAAGDLFPVIEMAQKAMNFQEGCLFARMSGSGSCIFGLFHDDISCAQAQARLAADFPDWWVKKAMIP